MPAHLEPWNRFVRPLTPEQEAVRVHSDEHRRLVRERIDPLPAARVLHPPANDRNTARAPNGDGTEPSLLAGLHNGSWLDAQQFPPLRYAVPDVIPEGFTLVVGAPKIGKSWFALATGLAIASGGMALGRIPTGPPRPVLLCALEDSERRLQDRCRKLLAGEPIPPRFDFLTTIAPNKVEETIGEWFAYYRDEQPVAILDTLGKVMPPAMPGESMYGRDYRIGSALKQVADDCEGSSLWVNHHDRKADSDDFIDSVSGSHGLAGAADTTVVLARKRHEQTGLLKVTGRDVHEAEYAVAVIDGIAWTIDGDTLDDAAQKADHVRATKNLGDKSAEVLAYVNAHPEGVTPADVDEALDINDARTYLGRLADKGRIAKQRRGLYVPVLQPLQVLQPDDTNPAL